MPKAVGTLDDGPTNTLQPPAARRADPAGGQAAEYHSHATRIVGDLPTGVIVGTTVIGRVTPGNDGFERHFGDVKRVKTLRKPTGHSQPVWFNPF